MSNFIAAPSIFCAFTMLRRNHMCLIFSTVSLLPTCWNLWILRRRMAGFVVHGNFSSFLFFSFFFGCHKCAATFFLALQYYEPNITITTHYPRSDKTKEMAMTKWLLCGVDLFSALQLKLKQFHLFTFSAISAHITTNTHARRQWAFHKSHGFMDNLFLFIPPPPTEKQPTHNFPITRWNVCKVIVCLLITCQIYIFSNHFLLKLFFGEAGKKFLINFWNGFRNVEVDASGKEKQGSRMRCQETWRNCGIVRIFS